METLKRRTQSNAVTDTVIVVTLFVLACLAYHQGSLIRDLRQDVEKLKMGKSDWVRTSVYGDPVMTKTKDYTLVELDSGFQAWTGRESKGMTWTLPESRIGAHFKFYNASTNQLVIKATGKDVFQKGQETVGSQASADQLGAFLSIRCMEIGKWRMVKLNGDWSIR